jgi:hypothetical protein
MNHVISIPEGIDSLIQQQQILLYDRLILLWGEMGLSHSNFQMYGRTYRNYKKGGYIPQAFIGGKEYSRDLYFDDKLAGLMWYGLNDPERITNETEHLYNVSLYGFVNLDMLKPGITSQRMDMAVTNDVVKLCNSYGFKPTDIYRDIDHVTDKFSGVVRTQMLNDDMHPLFAFRIDMENLLRLNNCNAASFNYPTYQNAVTISYTAVFKDTPNTSLRVPLANGMPVQLEFPTGASVTIPYLAGKITLKGQLLNTYPAVLGYNQVTGTVTAPEGGFLNDDVLIIDVNVP